MVWSRDAPLTPSDDEARQWAERELAKPVYHQGPSLLDRLLEWLAELWERLTSVDSTLGPLFVPLAVLAGIVVLVGVALILGGPVRRRRLGRAKASFDVLDDDDDRTSDVLRQAADAAAAQGDFALAVLERFRSIVRSLDERTVLEDRQGRTAHEAAVTAGTRLPSSASELLRAATLFDGVCYGSERPGAAEDTWLRGVAAQVAATKPVRATEAAAIDAWAGVR